MTGPRTIALDTKTNPVFAVAAEYGPPLVPVPDA
jgi:hypothetical protein